MTIEQLLRVVRKQWLTLVLCVTGLILISAGVTAILPSSYTSRTTLYIAANQTGSQNATFAYQGTLLSQQRTKSYTELLMGTRVGSDVAEQLNLPLTGSEVASKITASSAPDTVLIELAAQDEDPARAAAIANAAAESFGRLVLQLERPATPTAQLPVDVRVVERAVPSVEASSPQWNVNLGAGALLGLIFGVILSLVRDRRDDSIQDSRQLAELSGAAVLGVIPDDKKAMDVPIRDFASGASLSAEAYRKLRTNLSFVEVDKRSKVVMFSSGVPGEGKTTTVCRLAVAASLSGLTVAVVDADLRKPRVAGVFDVQADYGLTSALTRRATVDDVVQWWRGGPIGIVTSGPIPPNPSELLSSQVMHDVLTRLRETFDLVLVDSPPLLPVTDAASLASHVDSVVLVCAAGKSTSGIVGECLETLRNVGRSPVGVVLNFATGASRSSYGYEAYGEQASDTTDTIRPARTTHAANARRSSQSTTRMGR